MSKLLPCNLCGRDTSMVANQSVFVRPSTNGRCCDECYNTIVKPIVEYHWPTLTDEAAQRYGAMSRDELLQFVASLNKD